ncbi:MAG: hypothetical protein RR844_05520 [Clostridium sp.]
MKKIFMYIYLILIILCLGGCGVNKATEDVEVNIGESTQFSEEEIQEAINIVKKKFKIEDAILTKLWYEEGSAEHIKEGYLHNGKGSN